MSHRIRLHALVHGSRANGPGLRSVVWVQGCSLRCQGCFNPETHPFSGGTWRSVRRLAEELASASTNGLTLSGGEPTDQLATATELLQLYHELCGRTVVLYSGRDLDEIRMLDGGNRLLRAVDAAILGRYQAMLPETGNPWGSSNQRLHLLTGRLSPQDFPGHVAEVLIRADGTCALTGYPDRQLISSLKHECQPQVSNGAACPETRG
jgi:anaerobic ribonucleoside-triphosphate reductase activating protein